MATEGLGKVLIDTSAWIDFFRKKGPTFSAVAKLLEERRICSAGLIVAELMQGVKSEKELSVIREFSSVFDFFPETLQTWEQAGELSFAMRKKGVTIGLSDCYIAILAHDNDVLLLTLDAHFKLIQKEIAISLFIP